MTKEMRMARDGGFVRQGGTLAQWLPLLVAANEEDRADAAEAIGGMWKGTVGYSSTDEVEKGEGEFGAAVRAAVNAEGFKRAEFVGKLLRLRMEVGRGREAVKPVGMVSYLVFSALGEELMDGAEELERMLGERETATYAREALARIGPAARGFVPVLLGELDAAGEEGFEGAHALAAIGAGDPGVVGQVVQRLREGSASVRVGAAEVLEEMGANVAGMGEEVVGLLRGMLKERATFAAGLAALASVGRGRRDVMEEVVGYARAREPRWGVVKKGKYEKPFDEVMGERGEAIRALRRFAGFAGEVVPVLAAAMDDFEEFDSQWVRGETGHARVVESLRAFGRAASAAVAGLARHVRQADGEVDWEVVDLLVGLGPAAGEAVPAMEEMGRALRADPERVEEAERLARGIARVCGAG